MNKTLAALLITGTMLSPAQAQYPMGFFAHPDSYYEDMCKSAVQKFAKDRWEYDLKHDHTDNVTILYDTYYNPKKDMVCVGLFTEFYKKDNEVPLLQMTVIDIHKRELRALYYATGKGGVECDIKIDGVVAHCMDEEDFSAQIKKHFEIDFHVKDIPPTSQWHVEHVE